MAFAIFAIFALDVGSIFVLIHLRDSFAFQQKPRNYFSFGLVVMVTTFISVTLATSRRTLMPISLANITMKGKINMREVRLLTDYLAVQSEGSILE